MLVGVALVEFCAAAGEHLTRELVGAGAPHSALSLHAWVAFIGAIPGGWLGDRYLGARRATVLGTILALAGLAVVAFPGSLTMSVGLAARAIGVALLRGNTFVLLGRLLEDPRHRLELFLWVGFASSVGGTSAALMRSAFPGTGVAMVTAAIVAGLSVVALRALRRSTAMADLPQPQRGGRPLIGRPAAALALSVAAVAVLVFFVERFAWWTAISPWVFPGSALLAFVVFLIWWLTATHGLSLADNRRIRAFFKLAAYAIALGAVSAFVSGATPEPSDTWQRSFLGLLFIGLAVFLRWRAQTHPAPAAAGVFSVAFFLQSAACLGFATLVVAPSLDALDVVQLVLDAVVIGASGLASVLVMAAGRSAATSLAPALLVGTMLGVWRTSATIGSGLVSTLVPPGTLDRDTHGIALMAVAAACVLLGLLLQTHRQVLARDEVAAPPPPPAPSRLRTASMSLSGALAVLGLVWIVVGRGLGNDTILAAARTVTFGDSATAYLPNDGRYGFIRFAPDAFSFGKTPMGSGDMWTEYSITLGALLVAKYEVTVAQYKLCVAEGACRPADPRATEGPDEWPVRHVSWFEANRYCVWLEQRLTAINPALLQASDGLHVALPSEPEWERSASGGDVEGYPWRGPLTPARANYAASARLGPAPVGEFTAGATAEGIHDLSGNVAEWTRSEYREYPYDANDGREDVNSGAATRVIRGGSYYDGASLLKVTARQAADPSRGYEFVGFRVVITRFQPQVESEPQYQQSAPPATAQ
jgi:formylglycine-generating enzyme required for sulfatase activity/dipeptide/tripeptide permease